MLLISSNTRLRLVLFMLLISFFTADGEDPGDSPNIDDVMVIKDSHQMLSSGKHLRILPSTTNAPALIVKRDPVDRRFIAVSGVILPILEWLSITLNFSYEFADEFHGVDMLEDAGPNKPGQMSYILDGHVDLLLGIFLLLEKRNNFVDFPYPWVKSSAAVMIPSPKAGDSKNNQWNKLDAVFKPFQAQVWLCLGVVLIVAVASLYGLSRCLSFAWRQFYDGDDDNQLQLTPVEREKNRLRSAFNFIFSTILLQSGPIKVGIGNLEKRKTLAIRLMTGAWCLSCFVLITAYCSVLISFLTAPDKLKPLINSIEDLPKFPNIKVNLVKGWGPDIWLQQVSKDAEQGKPTPASFKYVADQLKKHPEQRYSSITQCLDQVRGGSSVYMFDYKTILGIIGADLKKTGRCDFSVAKEQFSLALAGIILQKNSPYTNEFSLSIMRMEQAGLIDYWWRQYSPADPTPCLASNYHKKRKGEGEDRKRLTLKSLSGAFIILIAGYILSVLVFIIERSIWRMKEDYTSTVMAVTEHSDSIATISPVNKIIGEQQVEEKKELASSLIDNQNKNVSLFLEELDELIQTVD